MKKFVALLIIIFLSCIIGGIYGMMHDFLTYSISNEYYTKFKFIKFGVVFHYDNGEIYHDYPLVPVAIVGWKATWWMGLFIGTLLGLVALLLPNWKIMLQTALKAIGITMIIAFITGLLGLAYGWLFLTGKLDALKASGWFIPHGLEQPERFIMVGSMHNFSYLGGALGLIAGIVYILRKRLLANI
jgi:hypothetical protein